MATKIVDAPKNNKVLLDWDEVLRIFWKKCKRDWTIYSDSPFRKFWDVSHREPRKKK